MSSALEIDDRFVDVDFEKEEKYVRGVINPKDFLFGDYANYSASIEEMTQAQINQAIEEIKERDNGMEWLVRRIFDQKQEGSCTSDAIGGAHQIKQADQFGLENVIDVSAISLYKRIANSAQGGSAPSDGMAELESRGILPLDTEENRTRFGRHVMPNTGFSTPFPTGWEETAKKFASMEWYAIKTMNALMTALINRDPVVVGREGHAICYVKPVVYKGNWGVVYVNSWGKWGMAQGTHQYGFGVDTLSQIKKSARWAFVLRSVRSPYYATAA